MKKVVSCILAVFSFMLAANAYVAAVGEDKIIHKNYSITFQASSDGKNVVKISAQYMFNEVRKMCKCLDVNYDIIKLEPHYKVDVILCRNNLTSDHGGALIDIITHWPRGKVEKFRIKMDFDYTGKEEHKIYILA